MGMTSMPDVLTAREREEFEQEKIVVQMQSEHTLKLKELELEVAKIEAKWTVLLKLPLYIVMLPVRILFGLAYICSMFTKKELPEEFWKFIK